LVMLATMGRAWRIEFDGALYHLMSRGNDGQSIFLSDADRELFLTTTGEMSDRFDIDIFSYVLMPNHYHFLIRTNRANLIKAMHWLGTTYTRRFNNKNFKQGHLFQGRYKSILVQNDAYVIQLSCYIHRNPLRAKIVNRLIDYKWSSYRDYAYGKKGPDWLSKSLILSYFHGPDQQIQYRKKVQKYAREEARLLEDIRQGFALGTQTFVETIRKRFLPDKPQKDLPAQRHLARDINLDELFAQSTNLLQLDIAKWKQAKRLHGADKNKRDLVVYLIWSKGLMTNEAIGKFFNMSYSAVSHCVKSFKDKMGKDKDLRRRFELVNSQFKL